MGIQMYTKYSIFLTPHTIKSIVCQHKFCEHFNQIVVHSVLVSITHFRWYSTSQRY